MLHFTTPHNLSIDIQLHSNYFNDMIKVKNNFPLVFVIIFSHIQLAIYLKILLINNKKNKQKIMMNLYKTK